MGLWNDNFEASPDDNDEAKYGAGKIREIKYLVSEREELEHNFRDGTRPFHKAGRCTVLYIGTTTEINALKGMSAGCIAYDTTLKVFKRYGGSSWNYLGIKHSGTSGLVSPANDHPQYLNLNIEGQTLTKNLTIGSSKKIDGRDISADSTSLNNLFITSLGITSVSFVATNCLIRGSFSSQFAAGDIIYTSHSAHPGPYRVLSITATIITVENLSGLTFPDSSAVNVYIVKQRSGFDAWTVFHTGSTVYAIDTVYQETYDCIISVVATAATMTTMSVYSGATNPPSLKVMYTILTLKNLSWAIKEWQYIIVPAFVFPVTAGQYWRIVTSTGANEDKTCSISRRRMMA